MEKSKTHWKQNYNYDYLGSYSLPGGNEVTLTMASTRKEFITGTSGKKEEAFVCRFKETHDWVKPMILNKTNCKTIEKMYGTPYIEDWVGKQITIYIQKGVKAFGDVVDALRIRKEKPKPPVLTKTHNAYQSVVDFLKSGGDISKVTGKYTISNELLTELKSIRKDG